MGYSHTQRSPLAWLLALVGVAGWVAALIARGDPQLVVVCVVFGAIMMLLSLCFGSLTVADEGQSLVVRFGPMPVFWKHIRYEAIRNAEPAQSSLINGWGIHYIPGRGWIYNLWGKQCVRLDVNGRTIRIGSDDAENLAEFIQSRVRQAGLA